METKFKEEFVSSYEIEQHTNNLYTCNVFVKKENTTEVFCKIYGSSREETDKYIKSIIAVPKMISALKRVRDYLIENQDLLAPFPTRSELDNLREVINLL